MLAASLTAASGAQAAAAPGLDVYVGDLSRAQIAKLVDLGVDRHELKFMRARDGGKDSARVEVILSGSQVDRLTKQGVTLQAKRVGGMSATQRATRQAAEGYEVYKQ